MAFRRLTMETLSMRTTTTLADCFEEFEGTKLPAAPKHKSRAKRKTYPPDTDIVLWLSRNAPSTFEELIDVRYSLYHRCSRATFVINGRDKDDFHLTARHSTLHIVSNDARRFLLGKLRELAKEKGWQGALPRKWYE